MLLRSIVVVANCGISIETHCASNSMVKETLESSIKKSMIHQYLNEKCVSVYKEYSRALTELLESGPRSSRDPSSCSLPQLHLQSSIVTGVTEVSSVVLP